jgi:hypothetical protein
MLTLRGHVSKVFEGRKRMRRRRRNDVEAHRGNTDFDGEVRKTFWIGGRYVSKRVGHHLKMHIKEFKLQTMLGPAMEETWVLSFDL